MNKEEKLVDVHLREFHKLKDEQMTRISYRDNLVYATLASVAAVFGYSVTHPDQHLVLLALPPAGFILGWMYLTNDEKISALGRYFREDLSVRLTRLTGESRPLLGWELMNRRDHRRPRRKWMQLIVDLMIFAIPGGMALGVFLERNWGQLSVRDSTIWSLEALMILYLIGEMIASAPLRKVSKDS